MIFKIKAISIYEYPDSDVITSILKKYNLNISEIKIELKNYTFVHRNPSKGFQMDLSTQLEEFFKKLFKNKPYTVCLGGRYSSKLDLRADVVVKDSRMDDKGIYIEIEFRPNECKDILKFEIGYKNSLVGLGVLIVAENRKHINSNYITMPEYTKCKKIIAELKPNCPMLLIGIDGEKLQQSNNFPKQNRKTEITQSKFLSDSDSTNQSMNEQIPTITSPSQQITKHLDKDKIDIQNRDKLVTSSLKTFDWLRKIKSRVEEKNISLKYSKSKYWASFQSPQTNRNIAYLQPQKNQIRLFTRLNISFDPSLEQTPASSGWAKMYPTIFKIKSEISIDKSVEFIIKSYKEDISK